MSSEIGGRIRFRACHPPLRLTVGDTHFEYFAGGRGPNALLVLGGALSFGDTCRHLFSRFEAEGRVLSPSYPPLPTTDAVVDALVKLLDHEGLETVDVFGYGLGAGLAHLLVRRHPRRVSRLALAGFGLPTPLRAGAMRALAEMFELAPTGAVHSHFERVFQRHAVLAEEAARANELLAIARGLLERHSRQSALHHFRLQTDLWRPDDAYEVHRRVDTPALLLFANDEPAFTRSEQDRLQRTYPSSTVIRYRNAGRIVGLTAAPEIERKLEVFFRWHAGKNAGSADRSTAFTRNCLTNASWSALERRSPWQNTTAAASDSAR